MKAIAMFVAIVILIGCSNRAVYENLQINQRNECLKLPQSQYDECVAGLDKPYREYERERQETTNE